MLNDIGCKIFYLKFSFLLCLIALVGCGESSSYDCYLGSCKEIDGGVFSTLESCNDYCNIDINSDNINTNDIDSSDDDSSNDDSSNDDNSPANRWGCTSGMVNGVYKNWCEYQPNGTFLNRDDCINYCEALPDPGPCNCGVIKSEVYDGYYLNVLVKENCVENTLKFKFRYGYIEYDNFVDTYSLTGNVGNQYCW